MWSGIDVIDCLSINHSVTVIKFTSYIPHLGRFVWYRYFTECSVNAHLK